MPFNNTSLHTFPHALKPVPAFEVIATKYQLLKKHKLH